MKNCFECSKLCEERDMNSWTSNEICDDCWDKHMEEEYNDYQKFDEQEGKCFLCFKSVSGWCIREYDNMERMVCSNCAKKEDEIS